ncbi:rho GTPase-activating protein 24-like [Lineus longissimus]|uniref:rho GTPase-activating protein 24-like n=1 Tax=Lineus longissimus TaxID=88925 RepID=UPI00315DD2CA
MTSLQRSLSQYSRNRSPRRSPQPQPKCQQKRLKAGFLRKQGGNFKTWTNRWFVIRGDQMYYYAKDDEVKELGVIPLPGNKVVSHPHSMEEPGKYLFEILAGRGQARVTAAHETYLIWASTKEERESWISTINRVIYAQSGGGVFGQSLAETMMHERRRKTGRSVPKVVEDCVNYLTAHGMDVEGIFRLPGLSKTIKKLKLDYDMAVDIDLTRDEVDVNSIASLLKLYFRELPEPVIPFQYYEMFLTMGLKVEHGDTRAMDTIRSLLDQLPVDNYNLLEYLCKFLEEVSKHCDENKMPAMNLALVFGPNVLKCNIDDPSLLMDTTSLTTKTVFIFILKHDEIFIREIDESSPQGSTDNSLTFNSRTLGRPKSPLASSSENSPVQRRPMKSPLCRSLPQQSEPFRGDLPLLSPETGEAKSLTSLSDLSDDSIREKIYTMTAEGRVSYRSGSNSRRNTRSDQIGKCRQYASESWEPSSSESSPEILESSTIRDGIQRNISGSASGNEQPVSIKPMPPKRTNRKNSEKDNVDISNSLQQPIGVERSVLSGEPGGNVASSEFIKSIPPKRNSRKKHNRNPSDANSEVSVESLSSLRDTEDDAQSVPGSGYSSPSGVALKGASMNEADSAMVATLMKTVTSLEQALQEQDMRRHREVNEVKQKYDTKMKTMEDTFKEKINHMANLLMDQKVAMSQTVDRIVVVQAELQRYQMKYGHLENASDVKQ